MTSPPPPPGPEAKISAALERLGQLQRMLLQRAATDHGISPIQAHILLQLSRRPGTRQPAELAAAFHVTRATISDALAALRRKNLVVARHDEADHRRTNLALTGSGHALVAELSSWDEPLRRHVAGWSAADQGSLLANLLSLIATLQRAGLVPTQQMCLTCRFFRPDEHPNAAAPHHCALLHTPLAETELRLDCPEYAHLA